jgi:hypothetical protein
MTLTREYFGDPWNSGVCEMGARAPTPVGERCMLCRSAIEEGDRGLFTWQVRGKPPTPVPCPVHRECLMREVTGGIGHLTDHDLWCNNVGDPDAGIGYRESALRVWAMVVKEDAT